VAYVRFRAGDRVQTRAARRNQGFASRDREGAVADPLSPNDKIVQTSWGRRRWRAPFEMRGGLHEVPMKPGLGVSLDEDAIEKYRV